MNITPSIHFTVRGIPTILNNYSNVIHFSIRNDRAALMVHREKFNLNALSYLRGHDKGYSVGVSNPEGMIRIKVENVMDGIPNIVYGLGIDRISGETLVDVIQMDDKGNFYYKETPVKNVEDFKEYVDVSNIGMWLSGANNLGIENTLKEGTPLFDILSNYWVKNRIIVDLQQQYNSTRIFNTPMQVVVKPIGERGYDDDGVQIVKSTNLTDIGKRNNVVETFHSPESNIVEDFKVNAKCFYIVKLKDNELTVLTPKELMESIEGTGKYDLTKIFKHTIHIPKKEGDEGSKFINFFPSYPILKFHCIDRDSIEYFAAIQQQNGLYINISVDELEINADTFTNILGLDYGIMDINISFEDIIDIYTEKNVTKRYELMLDLFKQHLDGNMDKPYYRIFLGKYIIGFVDLNSIKQVINGKDIFMINNLFLNSRRNCNYVEHIDHLYMDESDPLAAKFIELTIEEEMDYY